MKVARNLLVKNEVETNDFSLQETYLAKHMQKHADRTDKRPPIIAGPSLQQDLYWPKMDPSLYQGHDRLDPYGQGLMDPTRFHPQFAEDLRQQGYGMGGGGWGDPSKATSAFSPINGGVLPTSTGFNMGGGGRGYPFYDPISFQRQSQVNCRLCQNSLPIFSVGNLDTCYKSNKYQNLNITTKLRLYILHNIFR